MPHTFSIEEAFSLYKSGSTLTQIGIHFGVSLSAISKGIQQFPGYKEMAKERMSQHTDKAGASRTPETYLKIVQTRRDSGKPWTSEEDKKKMQVAQTKRAANQKKLYKELLDGYDLISVEDVPSPILDGLKEVFPSIEKPDYQMGNRKVDPDLIRQAYKEMEMKPPPVNGWQGIVYKPNMSELARRFGISKTTVNRILKPESAGTKKPRSSPKVDVEKALELFRAKISAKQIAEFFGISDANIIRYMLFDKYGEQYKTLARSRRGYGCGPPTGPKPLRPHLRLFPHDIAIELYRLGWTQQRIADHFEVTRSAVAIVIQTERKNNDGCLRTQRGRKG